MHSTNQIPHLVVPVPDHWGHSRPLSAFSARVVLNCDAHVTLLTSKLIHTRVKTELSRAFKPEEAERMKFVRVVGVDNDVEVSSDAKDARVAGYRRFYAASASAYEQLVAEKSLTCAATGTEIPAIPAPSVVIIDFMVSPFFVYVRKISKSSVKIFVFIAAMASYTYLALAPPERGGRADFRAKVLKEAESTGRPAIEVADDMIHTFTDEVTHIPGFPKMYHWEFDPQCTSFMTRGLMGSIWMSFFSAFDVCDGMILASPEAYEPDAVMAIRKWFAETGKREVWALGPLLPSSASHEAVAGEKTFSDNFGELRKFMDDTLTSYGEHSMLYISFGSIFWPSQADYLEAFVDVVMEMRIPFILSYGSPFAQLSDDFKMKVEKSGLGFLSRWSPQQSILNHPALGWFVTHNGHNSSVEAVSSGIPMICWPFFGDQPANAILLTEVHNVAYELIEVRTGNGLKPRFRTGKAPLGTLEAVKAEAHEVIEKAFGEDGQKKRTNVKMLQRKIESAWNKNGSAEVAIARFLSRL